MSENRFSWLPFFEELLDIICREYDSKSLYREFKKFVPEEQYNDIDQMDPLTFIGCICGGNKVAISRAALAKKSFNVKAEPVADIIGIPNFVHATYKYFHEIYNGSNIDDIMNTLWDFARQINSGNINKDTFNTIIEYREVKVGKLSQIMYICKPKLFYSCDSTMMSYLYKDLENNYDSFLQIQNYCKTLNNLPYLLSEKAWNYSCRRKDFNEYIKKIDKPSYIDYINRSFSNEKFEREIFKCSDIRIFDLKTDSEINNLLNILQDSEDWNRYNKVSGNGIPQAIINKHYRNFSNGNVLLTNSFSDSSNNDKQFEANCNQILYGPPGTGKSYHTVIESIKILNRSLYDEYMEKKKTYDDLLTEFNAFKEQGRIDFITFHQAYSYEEFVEGIKPVVPDGENWGCAPEDVKYFGRDGVFKNICKQAQNITTSNVNQRIDFSKTRIFKMSLGNTLENEGDIYEYCINNNLIALGYGEDCNFTDCRTYEDIKNKGFKGFPADALNRFIFWMRKGDIVLISNGNRNIRAIAQITGDYEYNENSEIRYHQFRSVKWLYVGDDIPVSKIYNKQLSQATIYGFYANNKENTPQYNGSLKVDVINDIITGDINKHSREPYVLIIDEINRGNISKIFGELITLIEEDKRGKFKVKLPYSQEDFTVPENLYIIGTMNTSDRSIASVDIALRRRFKFKEMMPKAELVADFDCNFNEVFKVLNKKISILLDRDHQIGHSYFIKDKYEHAGIKELKHIWFDSILPLLNEYFYGDWEKLQEILGLATYETAITDGKIPSFIKRLDDSCIREKSCYDNTTDCFNFVEESEIDFEQALKAAFSKED